MTGDHKWNEIPQQIGSALAEEARAEIWSRITPWLNQLLDYPGFREWKTESMGQKLAYAALPNHVIEPLEDFEFSQEILQQHHLISGYMQIMSAASDCRATQYYFRRYPFRGLPVGRAEHLRTCCELYYSRVYQFNERLETLLKRLARRTKPKGFDADGVMKQFREHLAVELDARNRIHHEKEYSDFEIESIGTSDLLDQAGAEFPTISHNGFHKISRRWQARVRSTSDKLDLWVGCAAVLMLARCPFLKPPETVT